MGEGGGESERPRADVGGAKLRSEGANDRFGWKADIRGAAAVKGNQVLRFAAGLVSALCAAGRRRVRYSLASVAPPVGCARRAEQSLQSHSHRLTPALACRV